MSDKDKKSRPNNSVRDSDTVGSVAKRELLGSEEFKRSKAGWFTGASAIKRSLGHVPSTISGSADRLGGMMSGLVNSQTNIPSLNGEYDSAREKFDASMRLHKVNQYRLKEMIRNTKRNSDLFLLLFVASVLLGIASLVFYPPSLSFGWFPRFIPAPILGALLFKHAYSNWMFRNRVLAGPVSFLRSGDIWPKK